MRICLHVGFIREESWVMGNRQNFRNICSDLLVLYMYYDCPILLPIPIFVKPIKLFKVEISIYGGFKIYN